MATIVFWKYGCDLRKYGWQAEHVDRVVTECGLKREGDCAAFFNDSVWSPGTTGGHRYAPRCRLYIVWQGKVLCAIPPVNKNTTSQVSFQIQLNEWLRSGGFSVRAREDQGRKQFLQAISQSDAAIIRREVARAAAEARKRQKEGEK